MPGRGVRAKLRNHITASSRVEHIAEGLEMSTMSRMTHGPDHVTHLGTVIGAACVSTSQVECDQATGRPPF